MKHIKLFESKSKTYWMIKDPGEEGYYDDATYLFDNEKDLFNFTANKVYNIIMKHFNEDEEDEEERKSPEEILSELDKCTNAENMLEVLSDAIDNDLLGDYNTKFNLEATSLDENIHIENWIELRRTAKKYNV